MQHTTRVIVPDSHGAHIDQAAADACLRDMTRLNPQEVVLLGDHLDCAGTFSAHQRQYTNELAESYQDDADATNGFLDRIQKAAPNAEILYLEGNHEAHVERWAARTFQTRKDADALLERFGPWAILRLHEREIRYFRRSETYQGLSIPGTIRLGKCYFTHGFAHSKHATYTHLMRVGTNVVHGHTHRAQSVVQRTVTSDAQGAWCPGTLAKLQPLYKHTAPSDWSHGYAVQFVNGKTGSFLHLNVPIHKGGSFLMEMVNAVQSRPRRGT